MSMPKIARFARVSAAQYQRDTGALPLTFLPVEDVPLPKRATVGSAGYDFTAPCDFALAPGQSALIPTGMRAFIAPGWVLLIVPRSSLGFKYRLQLDNTVGVIDSDYVRAANEGHIMIRMTNDSRANKTLSIRAGERFAQGLFVPFGVTEDDSAENERVGGFGSTDIF